MWGWNHQRKTKDDPNTNDKHDDCLASRGPFTSSAVTLFSDADNRELISCRDPDA